MKMLHQTAPNVVYSYTNPWSRVWSIMAKLLKKLVYCGVTAHCGISSRVVDTDFGSKRLRGTHLNSQLRDFD